MALHAVDMDEQHETLLKSEAQIDEPLRTLELQRQLHHRRIQKLHIGVLYFMNAALMLGVIVLSMSKEICADPSLKTYSPANAAVAYEETVFHDMPGEWSPYYGKPNDEKDELWNQLYTGTGILLFTPEETRRMPNQTVAVPTSDGDGGIYDIEVFHELHCLNALRKTLFPDRYPDFALFHPNGTKDEFIETHHSHCIDRLRQGVQCAGNVGANYYYWNEDVNKWMIDMRSTHTCRRFDKLQAWARSRDYTQWDPKVRSHSTSST